VQQQQQQQCKTRNSSMHWAATGEACTSCTMMTAIVGPAGTPVCLSTPELSILPHPRTVYGHSP
jgi:hypothetical protein